MSNIAILEGKSKPSEILKSDHLSKSQKEDWFVQNPDRLKECVAMMDQEGAMKDFEPRTQAKLLVGIMLGVKQEEEKYSKESLDVTTYNCEALNDIVKKAFEEGRKNIYQIAHSKNANAQFGAKISKEEKIVVVVKLIIELSNSIDRRLIFFKYSPMVFTGKYYEKVNENLFGKFLADLAFLIGFPKLTAYSYEYIKHFKKQFEVEALKEVPEVDPKQSKMVFENGTGVFKNGKFKFKEHFNPDDYLTNILPYSYSKNLKAALFESFLDDVIPDTDKQKVLQEFIGYIFAKNMNQEKALFLLGKGANGKSVFQNIITNTVGQKNTSHHSAREITDKTGEARAAFEGYFMNICSEISATNIDTTYLKQIISREPITGRILYRGLVTIKDIPKLIFNANKLPHNVEHNNAFFRRLIIIEFTKTIPDHLQDKNLAQKIIENELSGVFNWALEGLSRLIKEGAFTESKAIMETIEDYRRESDPVKVFLNELYVRTKPEMEKYDAMYPLKTKLKDLYNSFITYCSENGYKSVKKSKFKERMKTAKLPEVLLSDKDISSGAKDEYLDVIHTTNRRLDYYYVARCRCYDDQGLKCYHGIIKDSNNIPF